jgi:hypothetical protein
VAPDWTPGEAVDPSTCRKNWTKNHEIIIEEQEINVDEQYR